MRTTVTLDEDVYQLASLYARAKGITLSAAIGELIRRGEQVPDPPASESSRLKMNEFGYYEIVAKGEPITSEIVKELSEDELV